MEILKCPRRGAKTYIQRAFCGSDRDCVSDQRLVQQPFSDLVCFALAWNAKHPTRWVEIWTEDKTRRIVKITDRWANAARIERCGLGATVRPYVGAYAAPDGFTVDVPGIQDILKVRDWESKQLRHERYQRFATARSAVPKALQWIPPLLTKLDNAQDMLYVGLVLAIPLIRRLAPRFIPGVGLLLTINDILNLFT